MTSFPRRQQNAKLTINQPNYQSTRHKLDQSSIFLDRRPKIIIPTTLNCRPPTPNHRNDHPAQNVFLRKVKISTNRVIKSKTDHSVRINISQEKQYRNHHHYQQLRPIKSQSAHRSNSVKSFVIRKKNVSSLGKRAQGPLIDSEVELKSLQKNVMQQINQNSQELEKKFNKTENQEKPRLIHLTKLSNQLQIKANKSKPCLQLQNTLVSQIAERNNALELLQTKKSNYFHRNVKFQSPIKRQNDQKLVINDHQKQNFQQFRENCYQYEFQSSNTHINYNKFLRKQDKHKSNKQFDRKEKVSSACRTIRVPWTQINVGVPSEPHCQRLKKSSGSLKRYHQQCAEANKTLQSFGGISIIPSKELKSSIKCGAETDSLRDLYKQLEIRSVVGEQ